MFGSLRNPGGVVRDEALSSVSYPTSGQRLMVSFFQTHNTKFFDLVFLR
jgi:hypothetical protein